MQRSGYGAYRRIQTETSSPGELVVLLYDALLNDLQRAQQALEEGCEERAHVSLVRAQDIVMELLASLDLGSGELAGQLSDLYQYFYSRLVDANVQKDTAAAREVATLVSPLRDAWVQAVRQACADGAARAQA